MRGIRIASWVASFLMVVTILNVFGGWVSINDLQGIANKLKDASKPEEARALAQYTPTGGALITGTQTAIVSNAASGNRGSWRGTLASDNNYWNITAATTGFDQQLYMDGTQLLNANKFIVVMEADTANTTLQRLYQICDWSSSTGVDNAADAQCTDGGWRTLNIRDTVITSASEVAYTWHIYDGFWNSASNVNSPLSTPLSNFIRTSDGRVLLRAYSATNCNTCLHTLDYARVDTVIDPVYAPSRMTTSTTNTVTGDYRNTTNALFTGQSASDNQYLQVAGTASTPSDFYLSFRNIRTYPGANAILVRAEYRCSVASNTHRPKIWNFTNSAWEDLTSTSIACLASDTTSAFAINNVNLEDYVDNGEVRIGWRTLANGTQAIQIDMIYIIVGSTNDDSARCEISFGTGTASNCANTRTLDTTLGSPSTWQQTSEAESATFGHDFYALDNDADANIDHASSANLWLPANVENPARVTGLVYAMNWRSNATTMTSQGQFKDYSGGGNPTLSGGWTAFGTTNALATYTYEDSVTNGYFSSNPGDYIDSTEGELNVRIRTTVSTAAAGVTRDIDFVFASLQWVEATPARYTLKINNPPTGGALITGTENAIVSNAASGNTGSWRGTLASDNAYWVVTAGTGGLNQQIQVDGVELKGGNKLQITFEADTANTTLQRFYQICDWSSSVSVDNAADAQCTDGGWRTLNTRKAAFTSATETAFAWHVYDGFWNPAVNVNTPLSTPLSNFIRTSDGRVLLRAYSATNCPTCVHSIDRVTVVPVVDPVYFASGMTTSTTNTVTGDYRNTINAIFAGPSGSDDVRLQVAGTVSTPSDFYLTFKNIKTYPSMNAIIVAAEYSCSVASNTHRPRIWNFTNSAWEDLTATSIACITGDTTSRFALGNVDVNEYISNNEIRIGWRTLANGTQAIRLDYAYVMLGSVNDDSARCEISFGTGTASNCANTRTLDTTLASPSTWQQTSEAESATFGHDFYALDNDSDANIDHASSANLDIPVSSPADTQLVGRVYAMNWRSNATTMTTQGQFKDLSGANVTVSGGWTAFGTTNLATTYTYEDAVTNGYFMTNPSDYVDSSDGSVNIRVRTTVSTAAAGVTRDIDFVFASVQWVEAPGVVGSITLTMDSGSVGLGNLAPGTPIFGTSTAAVDVTNLTSGYSLLLDYEGTTSTLMHSDAVTSLPDFTDWNSAGSGNGTSTPGNTFSFTVATSTANYNSTWWGGIGTPLYAGIPAVMDTIVNCTSCNSGTSTSTITYRAAVPNTQKQGAYNGTSTFTALTNP